MQILHPDPSAGNWPGLVQQLLEVCYFSGSFEMLWTPSTAPIRGSGWVTLALSRRLALGATTSTFFCALPIANTLIKEQHRLKRLVQRDFRPRPGQIWRH